MRMALERERPVRRDPLAHPRDLGRPSAGCPPQSRRELEVDDRWRVEVITAQQRLPQRRAGRVLQEIADHGRGVDDERPGYRRFRRPAPQHGTVVREVDPLGLERAQALHALVGLARGEDARVLRRLSDDEHEAVVGPDHDGLMSRGVTGRREHAHAGRDLAVAFDELVARTRELEPLDERLALAPGELALRALDHDRHAGERAVLATVVEVQMGIDDRRDALGRQAGRAESLADVAAARPVVLVDPGVPLADAGIDQHDAVGVTDREPEDGSVLARERMPVRVRDVGEVQRDDVARLHGSASFASSSSVSSRSLSFAASNSRAIRSRVGSKPCDSSQYKTFDSPLIGPTSMRCSRPSTDAGTALYTRSASARSFFRSALITAAAWTPVPVRNASAPIAG